jgi:hypothetical protein
MRFLKAVDRPILAGRAFHPGDRSPAARTVIVNEAFVRGFRSRGGSGSPIGARLRYSDRTAASATGRSAAAEASDRWFEIVGVVRDLGLDPDDEGNESPGIFHAASPGAVSPLVIRVRGNPALLAARLRTATARMPGRRPPPSPTLHRFSRRDRTRRRRSVAPGRL